MFQILFTVLCGFHSLWSVCHCHSHLHCLYISHSFSHSELCYNLVYNVIILTGSADVWSFANLWTWTQWWLVKTSKQYTVPYQGTAAGFGELTRSISWHGQHTEQVQAGNSHHIIFSSMFLFIQLSAVCPNGRWVGLRHNNYLHMESDLIY